jgi:nicotinamide mononucleotide transporter
MDALLNTIVIIAHVLTVVFAAKTHRWAWLFSLLSCGIMAYFFAYDRLVMSSIYNAYGAIMAIIGFCTWKRSAKENERSIRWTNPFWTLLAVAGLTAIIFLVDRNFSHNPFIDSACTAMNIAATFLLVRKDINAWLLWLITDSLYIVLGITESTPRYILIYGVMLSLAIFGCIQYIKAWRKLKAS